MRSAISFIFLMLAGNVGFTQLYNNGAEISISNNTTVYSSLELINRGTINNEGTLILLSDWQNLGNHSGNGWVEMSGLSPQTLSYNGNTLANLRLDNPSSLILAGNISINDQLQLLQGKLLTSQSDTLLLLENSTVSGGSPVSYIQGPLHRRGRGEKFFPIGVPERYLPVTLLDIKGGNTTTVLEAKKDYTAGDIPENISQIYSAYYWIQDNYGEAFAGSPVSLPLFENTIDRNLASILNQSGQSSDYALYREVTITSGEYYSQIVSLDDIFGEVLLLGELNENSLADAAFYVPNALNPYASEPENRTIKIYGDLQSEDFVYVVYDRRGIEIFKTTDLEFMKSSGWKGTNSQTGNLVSAGAYLYAVKGIGADGRSIEQTGKVLVSR